MIVVGIDNAGRRGRFHEYFPWVDKLLTPPETDPQGRRYPDFLVDEVLEKAWADRLPGAIDFLFKPE